MAVVVETLVPRASKAESDLLDEKIGAVFQEIGGPPAGLMVHIGRPSGDGLLLCEVWRTESEMRSFYNQILLPKISEVGLEAGEAAISPLWQFGRP